MKSYYIKYRTYKHDEEHGINILASNKEEAYDKAVYEKIPQKEGSAPYSAWVHSVTLKNGNYKLFNTCDGNPY